MFSQIHVTVVLAIALLAGCGRTEPAPRGEVRLFAAASTADALRMIAERYQQRTGTKVVVNAAGSSTLAKQIESGAEADLFLSADQKWADYLTEKKLSGDSRKLLGNTLVLIVPAEGALPIKELKDLTSPDIKRVALAETKSVPAGRYAREALEKRGLWPEVSKKVVAGDDVRQTLLFVERGEADAGLVYASDAAMSKQVRVVATVSPAMHAPIVYWLQSIASSKNPLKQEFFDELCSPASAADFERFGFQFIANTGKTDHTATPNPSSAIPSPATPARP